jgi:hypothetical protein
MDRFILVLWSFGTGYIPVSLLFDILGTLRNLALPFIATAVLIVFVVVWKPARNSLWELQPGFAKRFVLRLAKQVYAPPVTGFGKLCLAIAGLGILTAIWHHRSAFGGASWT